MRSLVFGWLLGAAAGLLLSAPLAVAANNCPLDIMRSPDVSVDAAMLRSQGYVIASQNQIPVLTQQLVEARLHALRPGFALYAQWGTRPSQFGLYYRPKEMPSTQQLLILDNSSFRKAFGDRYPSCGQLQTLGRLALKQSELTIQAKSVLQGQAPADFKWGEFFLAYESKMYLRDGYWVDSEKLSATYREALERWSKIDISGGDFREGLNRLISEVMKEFLPAYCISGNTFSSGFLNKCAACQGQTLFLLSVLKDLKIEAPHPFVIGMQDFKDHVQPVLLDTQNHRYWNMVSGGAWVKGVTAPIFKPEILLDYAIHSPFSPLRENLSRGDALKWLIQDADDGKLSSSLFQKALATFGMGEVPSLALIEPELQIGGGPSDGLLRFYQAATDVIHGGATPEYRTLTRSDLRDDEVPFVEGDVKHQEEDSFGVSSELVESAVRLLNANSLAKADVEILSPITQYATATEKGGISSLSISGEAFLPEGQKVFQAAYENYSVDALLKKMNLPAASPDQYCEDQPLFLDMKLGDLSIFREETRTRLLNLTLAERAIEYDRVVQERWQQTTSEAILPLQEFLERSAKDLGITKPESWREMKQAADQIKNAMVHVTQRNKIFKGGSRFPGDIYPLQKGSCDQKWITLELRNLFLGIYRHAQTLGLGHREFLEGAKSWTPQEIGEFGEFYISLYTLTAESGYLNYQTVLWPHLKDEPIYALMKLPLQQLMDQILRDPEFEYGVTPKPEEARLRASALAGFQTDMVKPVAIQLDLPQIPLREDFCDGKAGVVGFSAIFVECPVTKASSSEVVILRKPYLLPTTLIGVLLNHLSFEYLHNPALKLLAASIWSERIAEDMPLTGLGYRFDFFRQAIFQSSPFLERAVNGQYLSADLAAIPFCKDGSGFFMERCKNAFSSWEPFNSAGEPAWLSADPILRAAYLVWKPQAVPLRNSVFGRPQTPLDFGYAFVDDASESDRTYAFTYNKMVYSFATPGKQNFGSEGYWRGQQWMSTRMESLLRWLSED